MTLSLLALALLALALGAVLAAPVAYAWGRRAGRRAEAALWIRPGPPVQLAGTSRPRSRPTDATREPPRGAGGPPRGAA
jgi:hypothetical protein